MKLTLLRKNLGSVFAFYGDNYFRGSLPKCYFLKKERYNIIYRLERDA